MKGKDRAPPLVRSLLSQTERAERIVITGTAALSLSIQVQVAILLSQTERADRIVITGTAALSLSIQVQVAIP
jgi:hypothetical protein